MAEALDIPGNPARRRVVAAAGGAGLAAALAACGGESSTDTDTGTPSEQGTATTQPAATAPSEGGTELAKTADIPEGGGKVFEAEKIAVVQPAAGDFKAFSAVCTHQGCLMKEISGGTINCNCHGSKFNIADGGVAAGPATQPLAGARVTVQGDSVRLG